eukprot:GHVN01041772.1.p1 GENE.GHVN01041772.1~~GHVN01041772.1.p1  ORF type:complete len:547 (-),score=52.67 GHVN01041772.1:1855-3495(-)
MEISPSKRPLDGDSDLLAQGDSKRAHTDAAELTKETLETTDTATTTAVSEVEQHLENESSSPSSKVILVKKLDLSATEKDIEAAVTPHNQGEPVKIFLRKPGGPAFIEFENETVSAAFMKSVSDTPLTIKDSQVQAIFSNRSCVTELQRAPQELGNTRICLITINNLQYPVCLETLHGLLSRFGFVEKIVSFSKKPQIYQALAQYRDITSATMAIEQLHMRNMYDGCNTLQILPSKLSEVSVAKNDRTKAWDFTVDPTMTPASATSLCPPLPGMPQQAQYAPLVSGVPQMTPQQIGMQQLAGQIPMGMRLPNDFSAMTGANVTTALAGPQTGLPQSTAVVIVYNIPHEHVTVEKLFNLFSLYGVVLRVKMMRDKPDTALIQFSHPDYAQLAKTNLHDCNLFGAKIQVNSSKMVDLKMPPRANEDPGPRKTMEFSQRDQRYKADESERYQKSACRPTSTLFIANVHEDATEDDIRQLVNGAGGSITSFSMRPSKGGASKKICIIGVNSVDEAVKCICDLHNHELKLCNLKLAFSTMNINSNSARSFK